MSERLFRAAAPRGVFDRNNQPVLVCPTNEQIRKINSHKNAEYFTTLGDQPEIMPEDWCGDTSELLRKRVIDPLAQRLSTDQVITRYPADDIGIRGSACSLGDELMYQTRFQSLRVRALGQILQGGTDSGEVATGLAPLDDFQGFPTMYLKYYAWNFRLYAGIFSGKRDADFPIFPLLLVYDKSRMSFDRRAFKYRVLTGPDRDTAVLRAFVLDYSVSLN